MLVLFKSLRRSAQVVVVSSSILSLVGCMPTMTDKDAQSLVDATKPLAWIGLGGLGLVFALTALLTLVQLATSRWGLVVFVSYFHAQEAIALRVVQMLEAGAIKVLHVEFRPREHDSVVSQVSRHLKRCHVMVSIPGEARSFVDAEILAATTLGKPIVFIKTPDVTSLPNTAMSGYPVLLVDKLELYQWRPLVRFCQYVGRHWRESFRFVQRISAKAGLWMAAIGLSIGGVFFVFDIVKAPLSWIFGTASVLKGQAYFDMVPATILVTVCVGAIVKTTISRIKADGAARQTTSTGRFTYQILKSALDGQVADAEVLDCLLALPLQSRHP